MLIEIKGKRVLMKHNEQNCRVQGSQNPFKQYSQYNNIHYHVMTVMNDTIKPKTDTERISHRQFISTVQFEWAIVYGWPQKVHSNAL